MSDYLAHLAERALAPKAEIRPRALSLFEPEPVSSDPGADAFAESREPVREEGTWSADADAVSGSDREAEVRPRRPAVPGEALPEPPTPARYPLQGILVPPVEERSWPDEFPLPRTEPACSSPEKLAETPKRRSRAADVSRHAATPHIPAEPEPPERNAAPSAPRKSGSQADSDSPRRTAPSEIAAKAPEPEHQADRTEASERTIEITPRPQHPTEPAVIVPLPPTPWVEISPASKAAPPAIHVTIGRLEIRATTPAPGKPQPKRTATESGLEEYLRRRSGGGAR